MGGVAASVFADLLGKTFAVADVACLRIAGNDAERIATISKSLLPLAQDKGVAVLLDDADLALKLRADGVHLLDPALYAKARRAIGNDGIVGVACPLERHTAMEVGEAGADYVEFQAGNAPEQVDFPADPQIGVVGGSPPAGAGAVVRVPVELSRGADRRVDAAREA